MSNQYTVVLDAGHGGAEKIGGSSPNNAVGAGNLREKDLTLDIARRTATVLKNDANVTLTRNADVNLSLAERADIARRQNASVFLSLHFNGFHDKAVDGTETFVATRANPASETLARLVLDNLVNVTQVANRGIKRADLGVLQPSRHLPQTAACLAEIAFLTHPEQAKRLADAAYRQQIAVALGDAVLKTLSPPASISPSQSFDYEDDLDWAYYQPLDSFALGDQPVFDIKKSVGKDSKNEDDIYAVKKRLIELGFDWITLNKKMDAATVDAIKLFQTIINGHNAISGDGKIDVGKNTHRWLQAVNAPRWQTMPAGSQAEGFLNFELSDTKDTHDFGVDWMSETIKSAAAHYRDNHLKTNTSAALLTVNDVSLAHGGNTPDHAAHEAGLSCDLQLPRADGKAGGINLTNKEDRKIYDRAAARAVLQALRAQKSVARIFFNDADLVKEGLCAKLNGHDDHIHFETKPPARGAIEMVNVSSAAQGFCREDDEDYSSRAFQIACNNSAAVGAGETFTTFDPIRGVSNQQHGNDTPNVFLRWSGIPKGICEVDVVVHFHGYGNRREASFFDTKKLLSGLDLSDPSGKNSARRARPTVCIMPIGKNTERNVHKFPFFTGQADALQNLIDFALSFVAAGSGLPGGTLTRGRLILTAHSGGGAAVADILDKRHYEVHEVHLFDATYGGAAQTIAWLKDRAAKDYNAATKIARADGEMPSKGGALRVLYRACGSENWKYNPESKSCNTSETETQARRIEAELNRLIPAGSPLRRWYRVEQTAVPHNDVPRVFGFQLLADASANVAPAPVSAAAKPACCPTFPNCICRGKPAAQQGLSFDYEEPDYLIGYESFEPLY